MRLWLHSHRTQRPDLCHLPIDVWIYYRCTTLTKFDACVPIDCMYIAHTNYDMQTLPPKARRPLVSYEQFKNKFRKLCVIDNPGLVTIWMKHCLFYASISGPSPSSTPFSTSSQDDVFSTADGDSEYRSVNELFNRQLYLTGYLYNHCLLIQGHPQCHGNPACPKLEEEWYVELALSDVLLSVRFCHTHTHTRSLHLASLHQGN